MLKLLLRIFVVLGIPALVGIAFFLFLRSYFFTPFIPESDKVFLVELASGSSFRSFCDQLESKGIIRSAWMLDFISQVKKSDTKIKAGEYQLSPAMSPQDILNKLSKGEVFKRILTVKEGMDIWQIAKALEDAQILLGTEFIQAVQDRMLLDKLEVTAPSLEGYLFPETYHFSGKQTALAVIWTMVEQFYKKWKPEYDQRLTELNLSKHEIITLASIIEKESGNQSEQPLISSVFHNRLRSGMKLESDPTLVYGLQDFNGVVLNKHKETESPYNTYKNFGLPPGPIANPGQSAIRAALYPEDSDFLFFVADGKGGHKFSTNLREHNDAVRDYRNMIREAKEASANAASDAPVAEPAVVTEVAESAVAEVPASNENLEASESPATN